MNIQFLYIQVRCKCVYSQSTKNKFHTPPSLSMDLVSFVATIVLVTASGALAPGPLFFATISHGAKDGAKTGLTFSFAHTIVEFSLVMLFALGLITVVQESLVRLIGGVIGGVVLLVFGGFQVFRSISPGKEKTDEKRETRNLGQVI